VKLPVYIWESSGGATQRVALQCHLEDFLRMPGILLAPVQDAVAFAEQPDVEGLDVSYFHDLPP